MDPLRARGWRSGSPSKGSRKEGKPRSETGRPDFVVSEVQPSRGAGRQWPVGMEQWLAGVRSQGFEEAGAGGPCTTW